jgi:NAD(P)-dependent dehydrogenase (short-subunit alcohol dehydrogenase family)
MAGRRVVVTAGASGIGRSIAGAFAALGDDVFVCDVDPSAIADIAAVIPGARTALVDLADGAAIDAWLDAVLAIGPVDVLVDNAGTKGPTAYVEDVEPAEWTHTLAVCLDSHYRCLRRVVPGMKQQGSGTIIEISSMAGRVGYGMRTPYASAKWALIGLAQSVAIEVGRHGVTCNAICPGSVSGPRMVSVIAAEAERRGVPPADVEREYLSGQSIPRFVDPSEIADLCVFLASPAARMISGQAIAVDGHTETYHI